MRISMYLATGLLGALLAGTVSAQHAGDIEFSYENSSIVFHSGEEGFLDGTQLFEAEFPDSGPFNGFTDEPGFISEAPDYGIIAGDIVDYTVLQSRFGYFLNYWNPVNGLVENTSASLNIEDQPAGDWLVTAGSGGGSGPGVLGQADANGDFHHHIDFQLSSGAAAGAYAVLFRLDTTSAGIADSEDFYVVWGYGIDETQHEAAIGHFASAIPEPGCLSLAGLLSLLVLRRKRSG